MMDIDEWGDYASDLEQQVIDLKAKLVERDRKIASLEYTVASLERPYPGEGFNHEKG